MDRASPTLTELLRAQDLPAAALPKPARAADPGLRLGFAMAGLQWLVRDADGEQLADLPALHLLPHAPRWFAGIANLDGALLPVFDLARWLDAPRAVRPMLLVVGHGDDALGLVIDGLPRRVRLQGAEPVAADTAPASLAGAVLHAWLAGDALHFELDVAGLAALLQQALGAPAP